MARPDARRRSPPPCLLQRACTRPGRRGCTWARCPAADPPGPGAARRGAATQEARQAVGRRRTKAKTWGCAARRRRCGGRVKEGIDGEGRGGRQARDEEGGRTGAAKQRKACRGSVSLGGSVRGGSLSRGQGRRLPPGQTVVMVEGGRGGREGGGAKRASSAMGVSDIRL